ncbi:MAG: aryl-sulfate sulfotransferase [Actinobacteria bacterium]|nr:aryl-sulfate sulfotransferase [Actinomycetota bacterium]
MRHPTTRTRLAISLLVLGSLLGAACSSDNDTSSEPESTTADDSPDDSAVSDVDDTTSSEPSDAADNGSEVTVEPTPYSPIAALATVVTDEPGKVSITATAGDHIVEVPTTAIATNEHAIPIVGMRQGLDYELTINVLNDSGEVVETLTDSFSTGAIDRELPEFDFVIDPEQSQPGVTIVEFGRWEPPDDWPHGQVVIALDNEGEIVWYYSNTGAVGAVRPTPTGTMLSHYFPVGVREFDVLGNVVGNYQVDPEPPDNLTEARRADAVSALEPVLRGNEGDPEAIALKASWVELTSIHHEAYPMPDGNILALSTTNHELTAEQREAICPGDETEFAATSDVIVEFEPDGTVVRTWDLWDVIDIDTTPGTEMCDPDGLYESIDFRDWTHANAVIYDEQRDAIIISSRHTDQVIALDHLDDTGAQASVRWILGTQGTIPVDGDLPYHQHAVELQGDGSIMLYDNGNLRPGTELDSAENPPYSRAVLYSIEDSSADPADWSATQVWEHRIDDIDGNELYARFLGDADRLDNGNILIDHGGIDNEDSFVHVRIIEVVPDGSAGGEIVWSLSFGDAEKEYTSYRAERLASLYSGPAWEI